MIYQSLVIPKAPDRSSEDYLGSHKNFYWLMDGATPPIGKEKRERLIFYMDSMNLALYQAAEECADSDPSGMLASAIEKASKRTGFLGDDNFYMPTSTIVLIKIEKNRIRYLLVGDSFLFISTRNEKISLTDDRIKNVAKKERTVVRELKRRGVSEYDDDYVSARENLIAAEQKNRNVDGGFWVLEQDKRVVDYSIKGELDRGFEQPFTVFAASDGFARLVTHLSWAQDMEELSMRVAEMSTDVMSSTLRGLEMEDKNFSSPCSSRHDDASFFLVRR